MLTATISAVPDGLVESRPAVFVPAIMGAGLVFSVAAVVRDVVSRGSRTMQVRHARSRGRLVAAAVDDPSADLLSATRPVGRWDFAAAGALAAGFAVYLLVGATASYLRATGATNGVAWALGASFVVSSGAALFAAAFLTVAVQGSRPPGWVWRILLLTPLLGTDDAPRRLTARRVIVAGALTTLLFAGLATWPHVLRPLDDPITDLVDAAGSSGLERIADILGSTRLTLVVAVLVGIATLRCRRFAWVFVGSVVASLSVTTALRWFVGRPRPAEGPLAGATDSFPSGHLVQITLLATLVPLAIHELTRSHLARRVTALTMLLAVATVAVGRVANGHHAPSDVVAGVALGLAIGCWARLAIAHPDGHRECRRCLSTTESLAMNGRGP